MQAVEARAALEVETAVEARVGAGVAVAVEADGLP